MELMQLEMLVAVAEERSFLRAAERVFRTQPAVSIGIRKLEGKVGAPLIERSSRRSGRLTPAGELLYEYARKILGLRDEALTAVKHQDSSSEKTLRVGPVGEESLNRFSMLWNLFKGSHPAVEVSMHLDDLGTVLAELVGSRLDVALISGRPRGDLQSKNLVITRIRNVSTYGCSWIVRQELGGSHLAHAFERSVLESYPLRTGISKAKRTGLRRVRAIR